MPLPSHISQMEHAHCARQSVPGRYTKTPYPGNTSTLEIATPTIFGRLLRALQHAQQPHR
jgi:hypothetical protein